MTAMQPPSATFIVFSFNQERWIAEAIAGALAQDCEPLEIVISDDCSTDRTWNVIQASVRAYRGPHLVRAVRNETNLGVIQHLLRRAREARGDVVITAAGDDVSTPSRARTLIAAFAADPRMLAVDSLVDIVDESGRVVHAGAERPDGLRRPRLYLKDRTAATIQGCAAAYRRQVFDLGVPNRRLTFAEDILLAFYIGIIGGHAMTVPRALVRYRRHPEALSNRAAGAVDVADAERDELDAARVRLTLLDVMDSLAATREAESRLDRDLMERDRRRSRMVMAWPKLTRLQRVAATGRTLASFRPENLKWMAARVGGTFPAYQPKTMLSRFQNRYRHG